MICVSSGTVLIRKSIHEDVDYLKNNLREEDVRELWVADRSTPEHALESSFSKSICCMTILNKGVPVGMFGVRGESMISSIGMIGFLGTKEIENIPVSFVRNSIRFVKGMLEIYPVLVNYVHSGNKVSLKWLKWLGARIDPAVPWGVDKELFHRFIFERTMLCANG